MKNIDPNVRKRYSFQNYNSDWQKQFEELKGFLQQVFGDKVLKIEHVGSTSVEGMKAKPVIDVLVVVEGLQNLEIEKGKMQEAGYEYKENYIAPDTLIFFKLDADGEKLNNIHICLQGSPKEKQFLVMRDYLRTHPDKMAEYSEIKEKNSLLYPDDYTAYRTAKAPYLEQLEKDAYEWYQDK